MSKADIFDDLGHVWNGKPVVIISGLFATCAKCGSDPSEERAGEPCCMELVEPVHMECAAGCDGSPIVMCWSPGSRMH